MLTAFLLGLALLGQAPPDPPAPKAAAALNDAPAAKDAPASPDVPLSPLLASHIGMELDDLDFEIRRQNSALQLAKGRLASTQKAIQRGTASRGELEQVTADVRSLELREAEAVAFRALKAYQRDVLCGATPADDDKTFTLVLDLLKKQEAMAKVELEFQAYRLKQDDALLARGAISRPERDGAELDYDTARLHMALSRTRQAQLALQHASQAGAGAGGGAGGDAKAAAGADLPKLKSAYLQSRVLYYEIGATIAKNRLDMAKDQLRHGRLAASDVDFYQKAYEAADTTLAAERKRLETPNAPPPTTLPRAG